MSKQRIFTEQELTEMGTRTLDLVLEAIDAGDKKKAKELVFTGAFIPAQEALRLGLVNKVVPLEKLRETVLEMAAAMTRHSPVILKLCKLAINKSLDVPLTVGLDYERDLFAICFGTEDQKEASKAFLEKRKPQYKGR